MDCILKNLVSIFQSSHTHLQCKTKNAPWITLLGKKKIDILVLNFEAMLSARLKVRKKDFSLVLA